mmetsp:Transcript_90601/g.293273  ORF Transcript_90601/g.293273 Transcript_90601/m.293273 type:complete len:154 (+) Transcript_90601:358-819(+)
MRPLNAAANANGDILVFRITWPKHCAPLFSTAPGGLLPCIAAHLLSQADRYRSAGFLQKAAIVQLSGLMLSHDTSLNVQLELIHKDFPFRCLISFMWLNIFEKVVLPTLGIMHNASLDGGCTRTYHVPVRVFSLAHAVYKPNNAHVRKVTSIS